LLSAQIPKLIDSEPWLTNKIACLRASSSSGDWAIFSWLKIKNKLLLLSLTTNSPEKKP
jgi:hypothetical protein